MKTEHTTIVYAQMDIKWFDETSYDNKTSNDNHWYYIKIALKTKRNLLC